MPTLTQARTAQLCTDIRQLKLRAAATTDGEHSFAAVSTRELGLEMLLWRLVGDLTGADACQGLNAALEYSPTPEDIAAYRGERAAHQQRLLAMREAIAAGLATTAPRQVP
jgi:hypothetical protein